jgi:hypothetical protein
MTDNKALREVAERVDREKWEVLNNSDDEYQVIVSGSFESGAGYRSYQPVTNEISEQKIAAFIAAFNPATVLELLDELEADKEQIKTLESRNRRLEGIIDAAEKRIAEQSAIVAAAEKLVRCKGRYHSEQNYRALAVLFGVTTPDLPPLEHENVHYADAAEMEIAALRQRIAELEARTPYGYLRECDGQLQISIGGERPHDRSSGYATPWFAIYTAAGIGKGEDEQCHLITDY